MDNLEYVQQQVEDPQKQQALLQAMNAHGENHWWESDNAKTRAYYQTMEIQQSGLSFYDFRQYHRDIEALLGRSVYTHEIFVTDITPLIQEVERAWRWGVGVTSEQERQERENESIQRAQQWASDNGCEFIEVDTGNG